MFPKTKTKKLKQIYRPWCYAPELKPLSGDTRRTRFYSFRELRIFVFRSCSCANIIMISYVCALGSTLHILLYNPSAFRECAYVPVVLSILLFSRQ